ncbi:MAG: exosortase H-associated membrane protein [Candidatus Competibacteraceae bacterium]
MRQPIDPLLRLLLGVALFLPLCLALWWWFLQEPLVNLLAHTTGLISPWLWPDAVLGIGLRGEMGVIVALPPPLSDPTRFMTLPLPLSRATVILPLFWGLALATPGRKLLRRLLFGTLALLPVALLTVLLYAQFQLVLYRTHIPLLTETPPTDYALALPSSAVSYQLWGLGRQLAVLVLPVVAPLLTWFLLHRHFLRSVLLSGWLWRSTQAAPPISPTASTLLDPETPQTATRSSVRLDPKE